nr:M4 family metallopeptidase [Nocardia stercoris]
MFYQRYTQLGSLTDFIGIDAGDGRGRALRATVRVCETSCPYANAYWSDGRGFVIGSDAMGLDVVAHELTHGVTDKSNGLDYVNESGAINESMSDIFGEFTALTTGTDHPLALRWKIGATTALGVIRDMKSPRSTKSPQPDYYRGPGWAPTNYDDSRPVPDHGGVHTNSGVGNKLAYLLTDGDTFNGTTVRGLGIPKVAALYWTVQTELYPSADYPALASTLITACAEDAADGLAGLTAGDCAQVRNAIRAVRIPLLADHV